MSTPVYPSNLPGVATFQFSPTPQLVVTDGVGPRHTHRFTRVPGAIASVTWKFDGTEFKTFMDWWRNDLLQGHRWFRIALPSAAGLKPVIVRFVQHRETQADGYKFWIVTGVLEILDRAIIPIVDEVYLTTTLYPIYVPESLTPVAAILHGQLSPPVVVSERLTTTFTVLQGTLQIKLKTGYAEDLIGVSFTVLPSTLKSILRNGYGNDSMGVTFRTLDSILKKILIINDMAPEGVNVSCSIQSGTLI